MWPNPQVAADLVTFNEEIFNGKLLLYAAYCIPHNRISFWIAQPQKVSKVLSEFGHIYWRNP